MYSTKCNMHYLEHSNSICKKTVENLCFFLFPSEIYLEWTNVNYGAIRLIINNPPTTLHVLRLLQALYVLWGEQECCFSIAQQLLRKDRGSDIHNTNTHAHTSSICGLPTLNLRLPSKIRFSHMPWNSTEAMHNHHITANHVTCPWHMHTMSCDTNTDRQCDQSHSLQGRSQLVAAETDSSSSTSSELGPFSLRRNMCSSIWALVKSTA